MSARACTHCMPGLVWKSSSDPVSDIAVFVLKRDVKLSNLSSDRHTQLTALQLQMVVTNWHFLSLIAANKKWRFGVNDVKRLVAVRCTECDTWTWRWRPSLFKHLRSFCRRVFICCGSVSSLANSTTTSAGRLTSISDTDKLLQGRDNNAIVYETSWYEERTVK